MTTPAATFRGRACVRGHTRRYVGTRRCVECQRLKEAQLAATAALNLPPVKELAPPRVNGMCKHGVGLRIQCRDCIVEYRQQQRSRPERDARDDPYQGFAHVSMAGVHRSACVADTERRVRAARAGIAIAFSMAERAVDVGSRESSPSVNS